MKTTWRNRQYEHSGAFRQRRVLPQLWPESTPIDERSLQELLNYIFELSKLIPFYDASNRPAKHSWEVFFVKDLSFMLARISVFDLNAVEKTLMDYSLKINQADQRSKPGIIHDFESTTIQLMDQLNNWYELGEQAHPYSNQFEIFNILTQTKEKIAEDWSGWEKLNWKKKEDEQEERTLKSRSFQEQVTFDPLILDHIRDRIRLVGQSEDEKDQEKRPEHIRFVYRLVFRAINTIVEFARQEFAKTLTSDRHAPQASLMISFLKLFQLSQDHLNIYTKRHLDYYFYKVLGEKEKEAEPDHTFIQVHLAEHVKAFTLPAGTRFFAAVDENGVETLYESQRETKLNQVRVAGCKTLFVEKDPDIVLGSSYLMTSGIYVAEPMRAGQQAAADYSWPTFGENSRQSQNRPFQAAAAQIGLALTSHVLLLEGGRRTIALSLYFKADSAEQFHQFMEDIAIKKDISFQAVVHQLFSSAFNICLSSADGWLEHLPYKLEILSEAGRTGLRITLELDDADPPVVAIPGATYQGLPMETPWPIMKLLLRSEESIFVYSFLEVLTFDEIEIDVEVKGLKHLQLFNEFGELNNASPFFPFGPLPKKRSYLLVGNHELKSKKIDDLAFNIQWFDLPDVEGGFKTYYEHYPGAIQNEDFQIDLSALSNYSFTPYRPGERQRFALFSTDETGNLKNETRLERIKLDKLSWTPEYSPEDLSEYSNTSRSGYFRLELRSPDEAFGHGQYPKLFADFAIREASKKQGFRLFPAKSKSVPLPEEPYTPKINQLTVDYRASTQLKFDPVRYQENQRSNGDKVFLLHPFGLEESFKDGKSISDRLLPSYRDNGHLYIGLEEVQPPEVINLYFQLKGLVSSTLYSRRVVPPRFFYLHANQWVPIAPANVLVDGTQSFTTSGIISLHLPQEVSSGNTILNSELVWIRISIANQADQIGETQFLGTNVVQAFWAVRPGDHDHFKRPDLRPKVKDLAAPHFAIDGITQLCEFSRGRPAENQLQFYKRLSERLRHKNRALEHWDYEHMVLEQFPEVMQVKCIGYNQYRPYLKDPDKSFPGGKVILVIVPVIEKHLHEISQDPHLLERIRAYLSERASPFADIEVRYPTVEWIRISGLVRFKDQENAGQLLEELQHELSHFICPWQEGGPVPMGEEVNVYEIYRFIESLPFVAFFTQFSAIHLSPDGNETYKLWDSTDQERSSALIRPSEPWSTLAPLNIQGISIIDNDLDLPPEMHSLERMYIENDLIVRNSSFSDDE